MKHKNKRKEQDKMNAVLSLQEYRSTSTPEKKSIDKKTLKEMCGESENMCIEKLVELESRSSSVDEFPDLWDEED